MVETFASHEMRYVLAVKPDDHKFLMEWVQGQRLLGEVMHMEYADRKGRNHVYEWINEVPLNGNGNAPSVNYVEYWMKDGEKTVYHNSWVTDLPLDDDCIGEMVRIGRSRWMIENEVFNTVKNHGYHIEHNYGHGVKNLSTNFFLLNLLAFFLHQIFERPIGPINGSGRIWGARETCGIISVWPVTWLSSPTGKTSCCVLLTTTGIADPWMRLPSASLSPPDHN